MNEIFKRKDVNISKKLSIFIITKLTFASKEHQKGWECTRGHEREAVGDSITKV